MRECCARLEAQGATDLPDQLGRGQGSATGQSQQAGREGCGSGGDFSLELVDAQSQGAETLDLLEGQGSNQAVLVGQLVLERLQCLPSIEAVVLVIASRGELVEVPAKPILNSRALSHQVLPVSHQEAHLPTGTVQRCCWQVRLSQRSARRREGINGVRLACGAGGFADSGCEPGRDPDHGFAGAQQVTLEAPGDVPAILERPSPFAPLGRPAQGLQVAVGRSPSP